jgi:hypothetical protein
MIFKWDLMRWKKETAEKLFLTGIDANSLVKLCAFVAEKKLPPRH